MPHNAKLQQAVLAELKWEPSVTAGHIGVAVNDGIVTLSGHVSGFAEKHAAERAAERVKGVKAIIEEIDVQLPSELKRGDPEITAAAIERLAWDASVPLNSIEIKVEKGWITLMGDAEWQYQKEAAAQAVQGLYGVTGVTNQIVLKPTATDTTNVKKDIMHALHRVWLYDPKEIIVSSQGGHVHLTGVVNSFHDWHLAGKTAWGAPGVTSVENDLSIVM